MPTSVVPTSTLALAKDALQAIVAKSATFQARLGTPPVTAAVAQLAIYKTYLRLAGERAFAGKRPFAIVANICEFDYTLFAGGTQNYLEPAGALWLYLTDADKYPDDPDASSVDFENFVGGVMDDLSNLAAVSDNLAISAMQLDMMRQSPADQSLSEPPYWESLVRVLWKS